MFSWRGAIIKLAPLRGNKDSLEEGRVAFPVGEDNTVDVADLLAGTVVVTGVPLRDSALGALLDLRDALADALDGVDLPVGVVLDLLDEGGLVFVGGLDIGVLGIGHALAGVGDGLGLELHHDVLDFVEFLVLEGLDERIGLVSHLLVGGEALHHEGVHIDVGVEAVDHTSGEVSRGSGGNGVLSLVNSESSGGEHGFRK
mmetsp:Transcript_8556/g.10571  ORF Transcript_8556/g.10571 Transcript_8556/m.10571 type:complete len:200 (+) Transcript_8556:58-657(+)